MGKWIIGVLLAAITAGCGTSSSHTKTAVISLDDSILIAAYEKNAVAADELYKDRRIRITGVVSSIGKDILGSPYVTLGPGLGGVQCGFARSDASTVAGISKGESVNLGCTVSGKLINVLLNDCERYR